MTTMAKVATDDDYYNDSDLDNYCGDDGEIV